MSNIRLNYLYRDGSNYKIFGSAVFLNRKGLSISFVEKEIRSALIYGEYFYPAEWGLSLLYAEDGWGMEETDWCEVEGVEESEEKKSLEIDIVDWLKRIRK